MNSFENGLHIKGYKNIACIDEVGRGCLLGDVVACAIILPKGLKIEGVKDSKKLSAKKREYLYNVIIENAIGYGIGRVNSKMIDEINIKESTRLAMKLAVENIVDKLGKSIRPDYLLIDAETVYMDIPQIGIIKGDDKSHGIACASIIAKVYRDKLCMDWEEEFPGYNIKQHKGYGTKEHREKLNLLGVTPMHRKSFLKRIIK
ncbi:ribonuclease HII [Tissierella creatinophila]|uniref:Ribonuclease HII n=1 Tax=Tissierella creatinophila DSM 6911 TaxID=1123403 RepID=A0A1U7M347_TISCR|nr:ribonuclease HII [Tissierella creatinophila]OLS01744.1 ribonuclease HII [Tissierella creatinophila DSM 6911]